ncbi:MAG: hypothetical protein E6G40_03835 [Actinobacteria bacterium]|jgi:hypothetical protein|nr:MAG: hypothetical protein E6G40_03835 [Actinomycetota bacterium]
MFTWHYLDESGAELGTSHAFPDQASAEAWMGDAWSGLRERGVEDVALIDEERGRRIYRMGLADEPA